MKVKHFAYTNMINVLSDINDFGIANTQLEFISITFKEINGTKFALLMYMNSI